MVQMDEVILEKDCPAVRIPAGDSVHLPAGSSFVVAQALGGSVTIRNNSGMYRVAAEDFDALGSEMATKLRKTAGASVVDGTFSDELVWTQLRACFDPEIPLNIVDLGLIYDLRSEALDDGRYDVAVKMTLTAPGCGMGPTIAADARQKIEAIPSVRQAAVDIVWDPQWTAHMISEEGRRILGLN